jgi:hypothetical protein
MEFKLVMMSEQIIYKLNTANLRSTCTSKLGGDSIASSLKDVCMGNTNGNINTLNVIL